jgi:hypothetical protein
MRLTLMDVNTFSRTLWSDFPAHSCHLLLQIAYNYDGFATSLELKRKFELELDMLKSLRHPNILHAFFGFVDTLEPHNLPDWVGGEYAQNKTYFLGARRFNSWLLQRRVHQCHRRHR